MRIAFAGFQHETNTFAPTKTVYQEFVDADGWPALTIGQNLFKVIENINLPVTGFVDKAQKLGYELVPLLWCSATPRSYVEDMAYEKIVSQIIDLLLKAGPIDGLYLDLHGAMVSESFDDGEGELLKRIRQKIGPNLPIVISLDLHANVTEAMVHYANFITIFRTYPHIDMAKTGERAAELFDKLNRWKAKAYRQLPFLIPLTSQCTMIEPAKTIYNHIEAFELNNSCHIDFAMGFPPADIKDCGPSLVCYAENAEKANEFIGQVEKIILSKENEFAQHLYSPEDAVKKAMELSTESTKPIILADTQDNPGAGTDSNTTGILNALIKAGVKQAVVAMINDPDTALEAHKIGKGGSLTLGLGGNKMTPDHNPPLYNTFKVKELGDGNFMATGPFYKGSAMKLGPMALLEINGVDIIVSSRKQQAADQSMFYHMGIDPRQQKILVLKSSVHFRADFQSIASHILIVIAPGENPADHLKLPYKKLRPGIRLMPMGPVFN
ncbi:MAG: M81 family metallopeptidase [Alphaproteobacteria bacterium]|nr:M81 family metallopeptidase [Alphaproteobacteria bacterium]